MKSGLKIGLITAYVVLGGALAQAATDALISFGADWKYLDNGSDQGTTWIESNFNDASWASGPAQLGYGDGDEATTVDFGPDDRNKYPTTYFRHTFNVADASIYTVQRLSVVRDDGVVVYLNGVEVFRDNMPDGPPTFDLYVGNAIGGSGESTPLETTLNPNLLVNGNNVVAVEIHQANGSSSDISFDLELLASTDPVINAPPTVTLASPGDNAFYTAPANIVISALANDTDGTISLVEFFLDGAKLGEDATAPYTFDWNNVGVGNYVVSAIATDNLGAASDPAVANVTVNVSTPPTLANVSPPAGSVSALTQITATFSEPVEGVDAADLLVNGRPARAVSGSGDTYTFVFDQPVEGTVWIGWEGRHGIVDHENPPRAFDSHAANATWQYTLTDNTAPTVTAIDPAPGATLRKLNKITISFSEPVIGLNAADLQINDAPAASVDGFGAGPYTFRLNATNSGAVNVAWAGGHGITDQAASANAFAGGSWSYTLNTNAVFAGQVVINEIMFHPSSERIDEEYIELFNAGTTAVNLTGWQLTRGVNFTFPNLTLPANGYLVVAANVAAFNAKYPSVNNVVGDWAGRLSNSDEDVELEDASGDRVDLVSYADEGDYAVRVSQSGSWIWVSQADGLGASLELRNASLPNNTGQNWLPSQTDQGTPGQANSVAAADIPPMIRDVTHFPVVPHSTDTVTVTARIQDELTNSLTVTLWHRPAHTTSLPNFTSTPMADDGAHNDGVAGDGTFGAILPTQADGVIVEFYVEAQDNGGQTRTWPAPGLVGGNPAQDANAFFQVDDENYTGAQPIYRLIMRAGDRDDFLGNQDHVQRNLTLITIEGDDVEVRHNCDARRRGASSFRASPPTMKLNIPTDRPWNNKSSLNLNSINTYAQVLGSAISRLAGLSAANASGVQVRFNGVNESQSGSQQYGAYAAVEVINGEWARDRFPDDGSGNVYSKRRPECGLEYRGTDPQAYISCAYDKESNASENDWSDLASLLFALDPDTTPDNEYVRAVRQNANVELWLRYFAVLFLMNYHETAMATGDDDDYDLYRGLVDPRFQVVPHDFDTIFGTSGTSANNLFLGANIPNVSRFLHHPEFEPLYFAEYRHQLANTFSTNNLFPLFDQVMGGWVPAQTIQNMKNVALARINFVLGDLPPAPEVVRATVSGAPDSPTYLTSATLTVGGTDITHYRYRLNDGAWSNNRTVSQAITLSGLGDGLYTVYVIGRNAAGTWQAESDATISRTWLVQAGRTGVVLNEVLARNDTAINHEGTFPDLVELYNAGNRTVDLEGLRLTDDLSKPNQFVFPAGASLGRNQYLVLYANNPDGTTGVHLGFGLNQDGDTLYLLDTAANGGRVLDQVRFGLQLPDLSVGRLSNGQWGLCTPTSGAANTPIATGNPATLKINEWLANGGPTFIEDFIELYNPDPLPVAVGGLYLTDLPLGRPFQHPLTPLSFLPGFGYRAFIADGSPNAGADHLNFRLGQEQGEIALLDAAGTEIDHIAYDLQQPDISEGRAPNGSPVIITLAQPTPGAGNPVPPAAIPPTLVNLIPLDDTFQWRYDESGNDLGTGWRATGFDDSGWPSGPALLADESSALPEPIRTPLTVENGKYTFYFRAHFTLPAGLELSGLTIQHVIDDGAVFYLNGQEAGRYNMPDGNVVFDTRAFGVGNATYGGPLDLPLNLLVPGDNVISVEVHQSSRTSSDVVFGLRLDAVIITNNPVLAGVVISEVMANNRSVTNADGTITDWIELHNPSNASVDLAGMSLTDDLTLPQRYVFPAGSVVPPNGYRRVILDGTTPPAPGSTGFGLKASGDAIYLFDKASAGGALIDGITFGLQAPDLSFGRLPVTSANWVLNLPTPGATNIAATLGNPQLLSVNEWLADPITGDDWLEIYNPNPQPVELSGLHLTDNLLDRLKYEIPPRSFIAAGLLGFQKFVADNNPLAGADHVTFRLSASGESIGITDGTGNLIDAVTFGPQAEGVSQGRLPDGSEGMASFPQTPTPGESNYLPIPGVVINEVLTHSDPPFEDAIELRNLTSTAIDLGGWYLSDARTFLDKFRIPENTMLPANGYVVFYENQFNPRPGDRDSFALSSAKGDQVYLSAANTAGQLTGFRSVVEFGPAERGVSFGRYVTSVDEQFVALSQRTFGADNPETLADFRLGGGLPNAAPLVGPVVISEIMYHPPDINGTNDNVLDEFIELQNLTGNTVDLFDPAFPSNTWRLRDAVKFDFPPNTQLLPSDLLLVVSFDPAANPAALAAFQATYNLSNNVTILGPYQGKLDNSSESVELYKPDTPQAPPSPDAGLVPYVLVDRVHYSDRFPWPALADGSGQSLQRIAPADFGNDPANWQAAAPTPGPQQASSDTDRDGMPDDWEIANRLDKNNPADASQDLDNDGATNLEEYRAGTDPRDPNSVQRLTILAGPPVTLQFTAMPNKPYVIEYRNSLDAATTWQVLNNIPASPSQRVTTVLDPSPLALRFYRLRTTPTIP